MCFGSRKKSKIIPARQLSIEKLNTFFTEYLLTTHLILLSDSTKDKVKLTSDAKNKLDDIKAKMTGHINGYIVEYNENVVDVYMKCFQLVENQFNTALIALNESDMLEIEPRLRKLKSIRDMFDI